MVNAIIPAAGISSRLYPLTKDLPKCLLKVGDKSLLNLQIDTLKKNGIENICIVVGYLANLIEEEVSSKASIVVNKDYRKTNSSYSLWLARDYMHGGFVYLNSDLFITDKWIKSLLKNKDESCMMVDDLKKDNTDMFKIKINNNRISSMDKELLHSKADALGIGPVYFNSRDSKKLKKNLDSLIVSGEKNRWCYSVFDSLLSKIKLEPIFCRGEFWCELDTIEDYHNLTNYFKKD